MSALRDFEHAPSCRCPDCVPKRSPGRRGGGALSFQAFARVGGTAPSPCRVCQVTLVPMPGICDACVRIERAERRAEGLEFARGTVPDGLRRRTIESCEPFVHPAAYAAVRALARAKDFPKRLALHGPHNAGKTSLAVGMLRMAHDLAASPDTSESIYERGCFAYWIHAGEMLREVKAARYGTESGLLKLAMKARFLVLDEAQDGGQSTVDVIKARFDRRDFVTVVTSWQTPDDAAKALGGGYARRAYEAVVECPERGSA